MRYIKTLAPAILLILFSLSSSALPDRDITFQHSTIKALNSGLYEGTISLSGLKEHGDYGIGTYTGMNGEMICLDGVFYRIDTDGKASVMPISQKSPFAIMTFFEADIKSPARKINGISGLQNYINSLLPSRNRLYSVKITGDFNYLRTRSVYEQKKPYPPLSRVIKEQAVFESGDQKGTVIGFFFPDYMKDFNSPGWHFHFLNEKKTSGGHVLDLKIDNALIEIDTSSEFYVSLPESKEYKEMRFEGETENVLTRPGK